RSKRDWSSDVCSSDLGSVELEALLIALPERFILAILAQYAVPDRERLDLGAHEAAVCVLGRTNDRLAAHVETRVDDHRAASELRSEERRVGKESRAEG